MSNLCVSGQIENLLVARNLRGMQTVQKALLSGYYLRAAELVQEAIKAASDTASKTVLIGTGFPVDDTFETDGPLGAIALYRAIESMGARPVIVAGSPLADKIADDFTVHKISVGEVRHGEAEHALVKLKPCLIISIERPGITADGKYRNMRGEDISDRCANFDQFIHQASCPTIAIGDGGNEIGMGNVINTLADMDIKPSTTGCDELLIADVSNWAAHGLIAMLSILTQRDMLADWDNIAILNYLSERGSVDGISRKNTLTEDGLSSSISEQLVTDLRKIAGFC
jgi:hypothetical protein